MLNLPDWVNRFIRDKSCPHCDELFFGCQILQIGVRVRDIEDTNTGYCLCFDAKCNNCDNIISTTIVTDVIFNSKQIVNEIHKALNKEVKCKNNKKPLKSHKIVVQNRTEYKIPDHEREELSKFLSENNDYGLFLKFINAPDINYKKR